jgi:CRP-like cAMP-binding protein
MPKRKSDSPQNALLAMLPKHERDEILRHAEHINLIVREVLYDPDKPIQHVYFVENGVVSLVSNMEDGRTVEVGTVGHEGMVGLPAFLGASSSPLQAFAQVPGSAWKIRTTDFKRVLNHGNSALAEALHRYTQALFVQLSLSVACNRLHSLEQRCARWLLITADRVGKNTFDLTQQFLAQMLGVRRASANAILQAFKRSGLLDYHNGRMNIKNRRGLESLACECYSIIREEYRKLTGSS